MKITAMLHDFSADGERGDAATCIEIPEANGQRETVEECLEDLRAAVRAVLKYRRQSAAGSLGMGERLKILTALKLFPSNLEDKPRLHIMNQSMWITRICILGLMAAGHGSAAVIATILAGGETNLPADTPSGRLDTVGEFGFVGALAISSGGGNYKGSAVAISPEWVLTAGHNTDLNDDGLADVSWSGTFFLPGLGSYRVAQVFTCTEFTGFANPSVNDDLALLHLSVPLPMGMGYPTLGTGAAIGDFITLVGFGRSGYGSYGYATNASLTDRRYGSNVIDGFQFDDEGSAVAEVFTYDFDAPSSTGQAGGSLGNDIETIIGPGDSGGAALRQTANGWELVGINTFTEGYGGRFGDTGGGVLVSPYTGWISTTTGVPEPGCVMVSLVSMLLPVLRRCR